MDIKDILNDLGLDFSNPEIKRGALEAIDAILDSRVPPPDFGGLGGGNISGGSETDVEIDPDLLRPSKKHQPPTTADDIEIEDEDNILNQIKHNKSEDDFDNNSAGNDQDMNSKNSSVSDHDSSDSINDSTSDDTETTDTTAKENDIDTKPTSAESDDKETEGTDDTEDIVDTTDGDESEDSEGASSEINDKGSTDREGSEDMSAEDAAELDNSNLTGDETTEDEEATDNEPDFDEEDLLDDALKDTFEDEGVKTKQEARKIKRERTLQAAKATLEVAKAKKSSPALIHELESAINALEALTEAVKSIKDISDDEFNMLINRVFDAVEALGDSGLTFTTDEERELKAQEIKADLANTRTQQELSAEDIAQIRAENQVIQAREKEANKYKGRSRSSFKGFQDFLNSLYRAIALQVHIEDIKDDSWSAINRRYSGSGVLQPGKRINELPNKKIPVIDFYFDQSGSWDEDDLAVGRKAVERLVEMEEAGDIKINIFYFANNVHTDAASARAEGGTGAWNEIIKNVISTQATNVIIMTDWDMEDWWQGDKALSYTVPGYVWYLWRNGENAPRLPRDLKGRGGTQQFSFSTSGS
jgi:hypothetical protein